MASKLDWRKVTRARSTDRQTRDERQRAITDRLVEEREDLDRLASVMPDGWTALVAVLPGSEAYGTHVVLKGPDGLHEGMYCWDGDHRGRAEIYALYLNARE